MKPSFAYLVPGIQRKFIIQNQNLKKKSLLKILTAVSEATGASISDIKSKSRIKHLTNARKLFFYIAREENYGWAFAAKILNKNHATAVHGARVFGEQMKNYDDFRVLYATAKDLIDGRISKEHL